MSLMINIHKALIELYLDVKVWNNDQVKNYLIIVVVVKAQSRVRESRILRSLQDRLPHSDRIY